VKSRGGGYSELSSLTVEMVVSLATSMSGIVCNIYLPFVSCISVPHVSGNLYDIWFSNVLMLITEVTICWWIVLVCHYAYVMFIITDHCYQGTSCHTIKSPPFSHLVRGNRLFGIPFLVDPTVSTTVDFFLIRLSVRLVRQ
jgi:hypothetical protein